MVLPSRRPLPLSDIPLASLLVLPQQCAMFAVRFYVPLLRHMRAISGAHVCPLEYHLVPDLAPPFSRCVGSTPAGVDYRVIAPS